MITDRIAILDGITMGGGVGLAMACSLRISTPKTILAMPEAAIGYIPDVGASYFLSRINPPELGLYLSLTGERLNGEDCYLFGITHYYTELELDGLIIDLYDGDFDNVAKRYHSEPDIRKSQIIPYIDQLKQCFDLNSSV